MKRELLLICLFGLFLVVKSQVPTQTIRGVVVDAASHETLPNANVVLLETGMGTITDDKGLFVLENVPVGRYNLQVRFLGYAPITISELLVGSGKEVVLDIQLEQSFSKLEEVVVSPSISKGKPINNMAMVSARTFSVEEARRYAGTLDDPGRMAGNFAGVTTAGLNNNAIVVRGNAPKGLLWRLEGVDIPVPSHFSGSNVAGGGGLTMFSSQMLSNSDFFTGAFPAVYGNATAGVFDMRLRVGNNRQQEYAAQLGIQGLEFAAEGPFKKGRESSFLFNYRYSTMGLVFRFLPETKEGTEIPVYQDLSFKINVPTKSAGTFSLWGIGGLSKSTSKGFDVVEKWTYPEDREQMRFQYNMGAGGLNYKRSLSANTYVHSSLSVTAGQHRYREKVRLDESRPTEVTPLHETEKLSGKLIFSTALNHKWGPRVSLSSGWTIQHLFYRLNGSALDYRSGVYSSFLEGKGATDLLQLYAQGKWSVSRRLNVTAGFNASGFRLNREFLVEPRLSAEWQVHPSHRFSLGYGNHSQTEMLFVYFAESRTSSEKHPNRNLKRTRAHHWVLGYDWTLSDHLHLKVEPYYQALYQVPVLPGSAFSMLNFRSDWTFDKVLVNGGTGSNRGVDITLERFLNDGFYYLSTASYYRSRYKGGDGVERRTRYDGGYVINVLGGKEWTLNERNLLGVNLKLSLMGPYWFHPVDEAATTLQKEVVYDDSQPFVERFSALETFTDLTLTYRINKGYFASSLALQVKNLAGRQYQGKRYNLKKGEVENEFFSSPIPFLSYKLEF